MCNDGRIGGVLRHGLINLENIATKLSSPDYSLESREEVVVTGDLVAHQSNHDTRGQSGPDLFHSVREEEYYQGKPGGSSLLLQS